MRILTLAAILALAGCAQVQTGVSQPAAMQSRAQSWWEHVAALSSDEMEGRNTGSEGYRRAAAYVVDRLQSYGLEPAGTDGFYQPIDFEEQVIEPGAARVSLVANGQETQLSVPEHLVVSAGLGPRPREVDAPLVFIGYGLHLPEAGHDDFAGVDLRGKIAVFVGGGPANISGALLSHARADRARLLAERGAVGALGLTTPEQMEAPWSRAMASASQPGMYFVDPEIRNVRAQFFTGSFNPAESERLFAGSGRSFAEISALADASRPVPTFALRKNLRARIQPRLRQLSSPNVVARLRGSDPRLAAEHVVLTAHLDGLGIGQPANGDRIYNGTLDNSAGVAALLDIAEQYHRRGVRPRRSILFVLVTGEEKGLLGSRYFSRRPSVPRESIVADLNYDMALPLFPLRSIIVLGAEESSIGADARAVAQEIGLPLVPDPFPNRNSFIRSDQYSFIEQGIPAVAFKFGFAANTPEAELERSWRATRYHSPSDDLSQTVFRDDEIRLHDFIAALALRIADAPERPRWNQTSFFRRFAR